MDGVIFEQFSDYFRNRNFDPIPTDSNAVTMYGTFDGNHLYLINLIQLHDEYELDFERYLEYKQLTMEQFSENEADKTILLNIIITDKIDQIYDVFNYTPDLGEDFIDVIWLVDKTNETLVIPKKQLRNVLRIEKDLKKILKHETTNYYELDQRQAPPFSVYALIAINILVWLIVEALGSSTEVETLIAAGAMKYDLVVGQQDYYRLFTAMFLHIGFAHLFHNMFSLYIFGSRLEKFLTPLQFMVVYLGAGLMGSLGSMARAGLTGNYPVAAGASGAVYGLMGSLLFISLIQRRSIDGINTYVLWLFFVVGIAYSVMVPGIDIFAHLGGFIGGLLLTSIMFRSNKKTDQTYVSD